MSHGKLNWGAGMPLERGTVLKAFPLICSAMEEDRKKTKFLELMQKWKFLLGCVNCHRGTSY